MSGICCTKSAVLESKIGAKGVVRENLTVETRLKSCGMFLANSARLLVLPQQCSTKNCLQELACNKTILNPRVCVERSDLEVEQEKDIHSLVRRLLS